MVDNGYGPKDMSDMENLTTVFKPLSERLAGIKDANDRIRHVQKVKAQKVVELATERKEREIEAAKETARLADEKRQTEESERVADKKHRYEVETDIHHGIIKIVGPNGHADELLDALKFGKIPHVKIIYSQPRTPRSG